MNFLLDTNVVSEWVKPAPNPGLISWLANVDEDRAFLSVITLTELRHAVESMPDGPRRKRLRDWLEQDLSIRFEQRVLGIDSIVADRCGVLIARSESRGRPVEIADAFIAATAQVHQCTIVTRNVADFESITNLIVNPWR